MAKLEAMLEQRGIATAREMSEAIARCQLHGGDLTTSLLQFVSADETLLSAALSECYGLTAAAVGALPAADDGALRSLPRDVAERYCCFPLEASPGRLVLAVAHPLEPRLKEELGVTLGVVIEERVALEVRIRQALSRHYGLPLSARNQRGIARLEGDVDAVNHETPLGLWSEAQLSSLPRPPSELPPSHRDSPRPPSLRPRSRNDGARPGTSSAPPSPPARVNRRREPMTLARAREELARASSRNEVLDVFFGFACQFFEYSALFAVHNALAEGLDAWGKGADREAVLGIGVPLDLPSSLSEAAESCKVRLTRLAKEGIDRTLAVDLERQWGAKVLLLPVSLRGRCAVLLYADNGEADVVERDVADLIALSPDVANALGRIILQRKKEASRSKEPPDNGSPAPRRSQPAAREPEPRATHDARAAASEVPSEPRPSTRISTPVPAPSNKDGVQTQPVVSIGPDTSHVTRARHHVAAAAEGERAAAGEAPLSGEDPVFLLARPQAKGQADAAGKAGPASSRLSPSTPQPSTLHNPRKIQKPEVSITVPARLVASRPRLPSVIVDPESADPEASDRATRAAAITRAPTQARSSSSGRRPFVPPPADAPRRGSDEAFDPRAAPTSPPAARPRETATTGARPAETPVASRPVETPPSGPNSEPASARAPAGLMPPAVAEVDPDSLEDIGAGIPSSDVWPPPIMDHSPPPPQPPLTALVPIIIADSPRNRRGVISTRGAASRTGVRHAAPSAPPSARSAASPTVPSPARVRASDPSQHGVAAATVSVRTVPSALGVSTPEARLRDAETIPAARRNEAAAERPALTAELTGAPGAPAEQHAAATAGTDTAAASGPTTSPSAAAASAAEPSAAISDAAPNVSALGAPAASGALAATKPNGLHSAAHDAGASSASVSRENEALVPATAQPDVAAKSAADEIPAPRSAATLPPAGAPPRPGTSTGTRPPAPAEPFLLEKTHAQPPTSHVIRTQTLAPASSAARGTPLGSVTTNAGAASTRSAAAPSAPTASELAATASATAAASTTASGPGSSHAAASVGASSARDAMSGARPASGGSPMGATTLPVPPSVSNERRSVPPSAPIHSGPRVAERAGDATTAPPGRAPDPARNVTIPSAPRAGLGPNPSRIAVSGIAAAATGPASSPHTSVTPTSPPRAGATSAAASTATVPSSAGASSPVAAASSAPSAAKSGAAASTSPAANGSASVAPASSSIASASAPPSSVAAVGKYSGATGPKSTSVAPAAPWRPAAWAPVSRSAPPPSSRPGFSPVRVTTPPGASGPASAPLSAEQAGERPAIFPPPPPADSEIEELVEHVCQGDLRAVQDLARIGAPSLPQVMARFPGPVISERPSSRASECGPLLRALAAIGSPAMPSITKRSEDSDARVRRWATLLLGEMPSLEACRAVVQRLADDEPRVHQAALDAARLLLRGPAAESFRDTLFEVAEADDAPLTLRLRTLEHVAKLKDSASVPRLVAFLAADVEPIVHKALWALTVVTRHDFGRDARAWTAFWNDNHARPRIEWLIDALDPSYPRSSKAAADELREEAGELFGYAEEQSPAERRQVQERFRTWWQSAAARRRSTSP